MVPVHTVCHTTVPVHSLFSMVPVHTICHTTVPVHTVYLAWCLYTQSVIPLYLYTVCLNTVPVDTVCPLLPAQFVSHSLSHTGVSFFLKLSF